MSLANYLFYTPPYLLLDAKLLWSPMRTSAFWAFLLLLTAAFQYNAGKRSTRCLLMSSIGNTHAPSTELHVSCWFQSTPSLPSISFFLLLKFVFFILFRWVWTIEFSAGNPWKWTCCYWCGDKFVQQIEVHILWKSRLCRYSRDGLFPS